MKQIRKPTKREVTRLANRAEALAQSADLDQRERREWAQIAERAQVLEVLMPSEEATR